MKNRYYSLALNRKKQEADINIFGDITSIPFEEMGEVSAYNLSKQLEELQSIKTINVHISSYGGEVKEGLAIYNALKNHKAKINTYCDGFACSIASVIFMAGDKRVINKASLLMIHNAWVFAEGNAEQLRKQADDLDKITSASINAYMEKVNIDENKLKQLMDNETWLTYSECLEMGFATEVNEKATEKASQSVKSKLIDLIVKSKKEDEENINIDDKDTKEKGEDEIPMKFECQECGYILDGEMPKFFICPECGADKENFIEVETEEDISEAENDNLEEENEETEEEENEIPSDEEDKKDEEDKEATQKIVAFFNAISK